MATTQTAATFDQRIVLYDVSWETYESLLANYADKSSPRFTYDRGVLEIVSPTAGHEKIIAALETVVGTVADEFDLSIDETRSTTFKRQDIFRGFEPDSSYYIQNASRVAGKVAIDLSIDPPPDLVIEIDVTNPSLEKLPIFRAMGVPEVWRYVEGTGRVIILRLDGTNYRESQESVVLPPLTSEALTWMAKERLTTERPVWKRRIHAWLRNPS